MLEFLAHSTWADRFGWMLVHSLWQFALLALVAVVLQRALLRRTAATRYRALLAAMFLVVAMPTATCFLLRPTAASPVAVAFAPVENHESVSLPQHGDDMQMMPTAVPPAEPPVEVAAKPQAEPPRLEATPVAATFSWSMVKQRVEPWLPEIVLLWFAGVLVVAFRPLLGLCTVHRLRTVGVSPVDGAVQDVLDRMAKRLGLARAVDVLQSTLVETPVVVGYFRPAILLPLCVVTGLPPLQLELILAHELAHIRRHDYLVNLLQTLVETLFFYHPAVWWLSRQVRNERENCCDDAAMATVGSRADYGRALLAVEALRASSPALSLAARGGSLLARIRRIAGCEPAPRVVGGSIMAAILVSIALLAAVTWGEGEPRGQSEQLDISRDLLPEDAVLRLGTVRLRHRSSPACIVFSPDGRTIASAACNQDTGVCLWDAATGKLIRRLTDPELKRGWTKGIAFSPDGTKLASGGVDGISLLTDVNTGRILSKTKKVGSVDAVAFAADGSRFASGGNDGIVHVWSAANGAELKVLDTGVRLPEMSVYLGSWGIPAIAFSPDGKLLAIATGSPEAASVQVWNVETGQTVAKIDHAHGEGVQSLAFTNDGKHLISGGYRRVRQSEFGKPFPSKTVQVPEIRFWDPATGKQVRELSTKEPEAGFGHIALAGNGKLLVSGADEAIRLWDPASGKTIAAIPIPGWHGSALAVSPDGKTVAAANHNTIGLWDTGTCKPILQEFNSHTASAAFVAYSPDGTFIVTGSYDGRVMVWDAVTGKRLYQRQLGRDPSVMAMALSPDGQLLAAGGRMDWHNYHSANVVRLWHTKTGKLLREFGGKDHQFGDTHRVAFSADGKLLAIAANIRHANSDDIDIWEIDSGKKVVAIRPASESFGTCAMEFSADSRSLLDVQAQPAELRVWDAKTGRCRRDFVPDLAAQETNNSGNRQPHIDGAVFSPDRKWLITSQAASIVVWDVATGESVSSVKLPDTDKGHYLGISRDGRWLAAADALYVTDLDTGALALCNLDLDTGAIRLVQSDSAKAARAVELADGRAIAFAFSPDNKRLVTGMDGGTALVWNLKSAAPADPLPTPAQTPPETSTGGEAKTPRPVSMSADEFSQLSAANQRALLVRVFKRRLEHADNIHFEADETTTWHENRNGEVGEPKGVPAPLRKQCRHWRLGDSFREDTETYENAEGMKVTYRSFHANNAVEGVARNLQFNLKDKTPPQAQVQYPNCPTDITTSSGNYRTAKSSNFPRLGKASLPPSTRRPGNSTRS